MCKRSLTAESYTKTVIYNLKKKENTSAIIYSKKKASFTFTISLLRSSKAWKQEAKGLMLLRNGYSEENYRGFELEITFLSSLGHWCWNDISFAVQKPYILNLAKKIIRNLN